MSNCSEEQKILPDWKKVFVNRQEFLKMVGFVSSGFIALLVSIPAAGFALNYLLVPEGRRWVKIGAVENFKEGQTVDVVFKNPYSLPWDGVTSKRTAWLRRVKDEEFMAFALNCTHLGCPLRWEAGAELFLCPCHGGVFYNDGEVAAGPPPRPMHRYDVRVNAGQVEISVGPVLTQSYIRPS